MKTIACVLKTGGWKNRHIDVEYDASHVKWLRGQLEGKVQTAYEFVCLSDITIPGIKTIPLRDNLPGWFSKMELFREFDNAFYIDLDTAITGDITRMVKHDHKFTVLRNLSSTSGNRIGSGVMAWGQDLSSLYREFMQDPERHMQECTTSEKWGDQGFIQHHWKGGFEFFQDLWPGRICSYKLNGIGGRIPKDTRICCYHGRPKPQHAPVRGFLP